MSDIRSSSPVASLPLNGNGQWLVMVGHAYDGGLYAIGPFASEDAADEWCEANGNGMVTECVAPEATILDRLGYPLHLKDAVRS
jgi:hypothetical protein